MTSSLNMQTLVLPLPLQQFSSQIKDNTMVFVFGILVFSYQVLGKEFPCTCEPQRGYCSTYMIMPCVIVGILMIWADVRFQRAWRYTRSKVSCHFGCVLFRRTVRASCVGLLWVVSVLIDGDWFVCCLNQNSKVVANLQCKAKAEITPGQGPVVTITEMKANSRMYGSSLLIIICLLGALFPSIWTLCTNRCLKCCRKEVQVHELILEVAETFVSETIKKEQESKLIEKTKEHIDQRQWADCLKVVDEFINTIEQEARPEASGRLNHQTNSPV